MKSLVSYSKAIYMNPDEAHYKIYLKQNIYAISVLNKLIRNIYNTWGLQKPKDKRDKILIWSKLSSELEHQ